MHFVKVEIFYPFEIIVNVDRTTLALELDDNRIMLENANSLNI